MRKIISILISLMFSVNIVFAKSTYQEISPLVLIRDAVIIVKGKLTKIQISSKSPRAIDIGTIEITKILKGNISTKSIQLMFPGENRTVKYPFDLRFNNNDEGIWLLKNAKNNAFRVYHSDCFQNSSNEDVITLILNKAKLSDLYKNIIKRDINEKILLSKLFRFEGDTTTVPVLINLLKDNNSVIREISQNALHRITNHIIEDKTDDVLYDRWQKWWNENKNKDRDHWIKEGIVRDIELIKTKDIGIKQKAAKRLVEFTGQYGLVGTGIAPQTPEAIGTWDKWWENNKNLTQSEWTHNLLNSTDPYLKQQGIVLAVDLIKFGKTEFTGEIVKALMDPYPFVKQHAIEALYILTGDNFGFDINNSEEENHESIIKWMNWLENNKN